MSPTHDGNIEKCKNIFPTWQWLVGFVLGGLAIIVTLAWNGGAAMANNATKIEALGGRVTIIENTTIRNQQQYDTIVSILRRK